MQIWQVWGKPEIQHLRPAPGDAMLLALDPTLISLVLDDLYSQLPPPPITTSGPFPSMQSLDLISGPL